jgi:chromosome partitioning protein
MKTIAILNQKGGVGKSTIACNLAVEAALNKKKVLLIDADVQGSTMSFRGLRVKNDIKAVSITTPTLHKDIPSFSYTFHGFDIVLIDAGERDTTISRSAIVASDIIIIPVLPSQFDIWSASDTIEVIQKVRKYKKKKKQNLRAFFLLNQIITNTIVSREAVNALKKFDKNVKILKTILHSRVAFKNSIAGGQGAREYEPDGKAGLEMKKLYKEIINLKKG